MILKRVFFAQDTVKAAQHLLGMRLVRRLPGGEILRGIITETEAYDGFEDRASHASRGLTPRNAVMFGPPGYTYLYLCYGMHWMLNITTREQGYPAAILIRGTSVVSGPGRVTRAFELNGQNNACPLLPGSGLWIVPSARSPEVSAITATPRIGVHYAGPYWSAIPWRFVLKQ